MAMDDGSEWSKIRLAHVQYNRRIPQKLNYNKEELTKRVSPCPFLFTRSSLRQKDRFLKQGDWPYHFNRVPFVLYTNQLKTLI